MIFCKGRLSMQLIVNAYSIIIIMIIIIIIIIIINTLFSEGNS